MAVVATSATSMDAVTNRDSYVDDVAAANLLSLSRSYLRQLRTGGGGCKFSTFGRAVRYRVGDLLEWAESRSITSTSARS